MAANTPMLASDWPAQKKQSKARKFPTRAQFRAWLNAMDGRPVKGGRCPLENYLGGGSAVGRTYHYLRRGGRWQLNPVWAQEFTRMVDGGPLRIEWTAGDYTLEKAREALRLITARRGYK